MPAAAGAPAYEAVEIAAKRIGSFNRTNGDTTFGRLTFRGGLVLTSAHKDFGGWSGLAMEANGRDFIAIGDEGSWLTGRLTYDGASPSGVSNARLGPILATGGRALTRKRDRDAEAVAFLDGTLARGTVLVAFERNHRIGRFPIVDRVLQPPAGYLRMPAETKAMKSNKGLEAMTVIAGGPLKGSVVALCERFPSADGNHVGWIWVEGEPKRFGLKDIGGFDVTDVASLADGTLIVLERRFRWTDGVKMQLRRIPADAVKPGAMIEGEVLITADLTSEIDNMEGLGVHRSPSGETILTLISDDNFNSFMQRTILLQFALAG